MPSRSIYFSSSFLIALLAACGSSSSSDAPTNDAASDVASDGATDTPSGSDSIVGNDTPGGTPCSVAQVGGNADFKGYRMFPADSPYNTAIDKLPVHASSADWLKNCSAAAPHLQLDLSMPYNIVAADTPPVTATDLHYNDKPYPNPWPFPADALIEGGDPTTPGDHHCLAFDVGDCKLYEVYNLLWSSDKKTFTAASGSVWDTTSNAPPVGSGSDAAGMPITPLLIRGDELLGLGKIEHAIRFTCAATQAAHIAPARASASSSGSGIPADPHDPTYPPMGMRVRLKASYDPTAHGFPPPIVAILQTIKTYGIILADNGGKATPLFVGGSTDKALHDALIDPAYLIKTVTISDLEVVDSGPLIKD